MRTKPQILFASSRMLIGLTFIVSGLTKGLDLFSTSLKVQEYFEALGLSPNGGLPYITACLLIATELFLGMLMTFGILKNVAVKVVVNQINKLTLTNKDNVMLLTSTPLKNIKERELHHIHIGNIDNSLSRKIIQSNLGFIILKGGVIEDKWQQNSLGLQKFH